MRNTKAAEAVETLFFDSELFLEWMHIATKEVRLMNGCSFLAPKNEPVLAMTDEPPGQKQNERTAYLQKAVRPMAEDLGLFQLCSYRSKRHTMPLCSLKLFCEAPPKCV